MTVLVCAPHPDDEVIGMGGTIAKYAQRGEDVIVLIFTKGESSHPWQRKEAIQQTREEEALKANSTIGVEKVLFLDLEDYNVAKQIVERNTIKELHAIMDEHKPDTVFTPALDDVHKDHRAVARLVLATVKQREKQPITWMYTVWNPLFVRGRDAPRMVVDITKTFEKKWKAIHQYKSQRVSTYQLIPTVILRGFVHGLRHGHTMAEVFLQAP